MLCSISELRILALTRTRANIARFKKRLCKVNDSNTANRTAADSDFPADEPSAPKMNNGFTFSTGKKYVDALVKTITFAQDDYVLSVLLSERLTITPVGESFDAVIIGSGSDGDRQRLLKENEELVEAMNVINMEGVDDDKVD